MVLSPVARMRRHPCFDEGAHQRVGRVHLPVAPRCNIRCRFCERRVCANLTVQHPGWARRLQSPDEALAHVERIVRSQQGRSPDGSVQPFVVGIAGPGEPLANEETFETLRQVHQTYPWLMKCISTNGLLLQHRLPELLDAGVATLTVTVNAVDAAVGEQIYAWICMPPSSDADPAGAVPTRLRGRRAAEVLIAAQLRGIQAAVNAGLVVKVNTVLIPGVNDQHLEAVANRVKALGAHLMNIMPLIPGGQMRDRRAPTCEELETARATCERVMPQFRLCEQCRADVVRFPGSGQRRTSVHGPPPACDPLL